MQAVANPTTIHLPTIGIQLLTGIHSGFARNFMIYTTPEFVHTGYCLNCGKPFWLNNNPGKPGKFCSNSCVTKFIHSKMKEENLRVAYKNVDNKELKEFLKKYTGYVYSEIFKYDKKYSEDLKDWWQEQGVRHFWNMKKFEMKHGTKGNICKYLHTAVYYAFLNAHNKNQQEVFYDECNCKTQQMILGDYNSIYD